MANKTHTATQSHLLATMMLQLQSQTKRQDCMLKELQHARNKLENASRTLEQKNRIIDSLEIDLEHMVDQLVKLKPVDADANRWISRPVPGLSSDRVVA